MAVEVSHACVCCQVDFLPIRQAKNNGTFLRTGGMTLLASSDAHPGPKLQFVEEKQLCPCLKFSVKLFEDVGLQCVIRVKLT